MPVPEQQPTYFVAVWPIVGYVMRSQYGAVWIRTDEPIFGAVQNVSGNFSSPEAAYEYLQRIKDADEYGDCRMEVARGI